MFRLGRILCQSSYLPNYHCGPVLVLPVLSQWPVGQVPHSSWMPFCALTSFLFLSNVSFHSYHPGKYLSFLPHSCSRFCYYWVWLYVVISVWVYAERVALKYLMPQQYQNHLTEHNPAALRLCRMYFKRAENKSVLFRTFVCTNSFRRNMVNAESDQN